MRRAYEVSENLKSTNDTLIKSKTSLEKTLKDFTIDSNKRVNELEENLTESQEIIKELNEKLNGKLRIDQKGSFIYFLKINSNRRNENTAL